MRTAFRCFTPSILTLALLLAGGLSTSALAQPKNLRPAAVQARAADSGMGANLLYNILKAELLHARGESAQAYANMMVLAQQERTRPELYQRAAEIALASRAFESALDAVNAWRRVDPKAATPQRYAIQLAILLGRPQAAADAANGLLQSVPAAELPSVIALLPNYFGAGKEKNPATFAELEKLLQPYTQGRTPAIRAQAWGVIGYARMMRDDDAGALNAVTQAQQIDASSRSAGWTALDLLTKSADKSTARNSNVRLEALITGADKAVQRFLASKAEGSYGVRVDYTRYLLEHERLNDALVQAAQIRQQKPQSPSAWLMQGSIELQMKQYAAAEKSLLQGLKLLPQAQDEEDAAKLETRVFLALARLAEERKDFKGAEEYLSQISSSEEQSTVLIRRANMYSKQGQWQKAIELLRQIPPDVNIKPTALLYGQIQVLATAKQYRAAYELLAQHTQKNPKDYDALYDQAIMAEKMGDTKEMERLLRQLMAQQPQEANAYNALGYSLAERKQRLPEAKALIEKALQLKPQDPMITDSLGWVEYHLGNLSQAITLLRFAYERRPDVEIGTHLAEVLWQAGQKREAMKLFDELRAKEPENETLVETVRRLQVPAAAGPR